MAECKDCGIYTDHPGGYCKPCYFKLKDAASGAAKPIFKENKLSEGEEFIIDFLQLYDIKYKSQHKIENLKGDKASFRVADFYLPKYDVYIEFLGQWNNPEQKERYKSKKDLYFRNRIACIYLYPENLGILPFVFDKRLQEVLSKNGSSKLLKKYRWFKFKEGEALRFVFIFFCVTILCLVDYKIQPENNIVFVLFFGGIILFQLYKMIRAWIRIFKKNAYPLSMLD